MSQGRPGDHPITDVLFHNASYFTPEIRALIKEVYDLSHKHFKVFNDINIDADSSEVIHQKLVALKKKFESGEGWS